MWDLRSVWAVFVNMRAEIVNMRVCEWVISVIFANILILINLNFSRKL